MAQLSDVRRCIALDLLAHGTIRPDLILADYSLPNGLNGIQLANPFSPGVVLGELDRTTTRSTTVGVSLQATNTDRLFGHNNQFVVGASFDSSVSHFISLIPLSFSNRVRDPENVATMDPETKRAGSLWRLAVART